MIGWFAEDMAEPSQLGPENKRGETQGRASAANSFVRNPTDEQAEYVIKNLMIKLEVVISGHTKPYTGRSMSRLESSDPGTHCIRETN